MKINKYSSLQNPQNFPKNISQKKIFFHKPKRLQTHEMLSHKVEWSNFKSPQTWYLLTSIKESQKGEFSLSCRHDSFTSSGMLRSIWKSDLHSSPNMFVITDVNSPKKKRVKLKITTTKIREEPRVKLKRFFNPFMLTECISPRGFL